MWAPANFGVALIMTIFSAVFWGSWANTYKRTRSYPFELFYWDYIIGVVICALAFAFTLGSSGTGGEPFVANLRAGDTSNIVFALIGGFIFNIANLLLVAGIAIAGLAIAFPLAIGIAVVEGVLLSYILQPKGHIAFLVVGLMLAGAGGTVTRKGIVVNIVSGLLMGGFAPFVTRSLTHGHALTPYTVSVLFSLGAFLCCFIVNIYFMKNPLVGDAVSFSGFGKASGGDHLLGIIGGIIWGLGGNFNFIAAGFVGVPISYAIGQSAPMIAAAWGVLVWKEFAGADRKTWNYLAMMFILYSCAVGAIALAYNA
jgi:glucose uptake protein